MRILALDASLARCSAAILDEGRLLAHALRDGARGHAAILPPLVADVLRDAGLPATALDGIAVGVGPGGFTGLRTALALAEGLAAAAECRLMGVTTGESLAAALALRGDSSFQMLGRPNALWTAVANREGRVVLERFLAAPDSAALVPQAAPVLLAEQALPMPSAEEAAAPIAIAGDAAAVVAARLAARGVAVSLTDLGLPDARAMAWTGALRLQGRLPPRAAVPLYAEPPAVRLPAKQPAAASSSLPGSATP